MSDVFVDVGEALKQERMEKLWEKYGKYLLAAMAAVVIGTAMVSGYSNWNASVETRQTNALLEAMHAEDAPAALQAAATDMRPGLRGIALLTAGGALMEEGDKDAALVPFEKAAQDLKIPAELRDIAILTSVRLGLEQDDAQAKQVKFLSQLKTIWSNDKSPWKLHARLEAATILAHFAENYEGAQEHLAIILETKNIPESLISKATALKQVYALKETAIKDASSKGEGS